MSTWLSIDISASMAMSATIMLAVIAKPFLQSAEEIAAELVVLPEHGDLAVRIGSLDVVGVNPSLGRNVGCQPIVHGKRFGCAHSSSPDATKSCGILFLIEIGSRRQISRRAERSEHQQARFSFSTKSRVCSAAVFGFELSSRGNELYLSSVDAAAFVDHVEIGGFALPIAANAANGPVYGMMLPMRISVSAARRPGPAARRLGRARGTLRRSRITAIWFLLFFASTSPQTLSDRLVTPLPGDTMISLKTRLLKSNVALV